MTLTSKTLSREVILRTIDAIERLVLAGRWAALTSAEITAALDSGLEVNGVVGPGRKSTRDAAADLSSQETFSSVEACLVDWRRRHKGAALDLTVKR